ncbi:hypothetical protein ACFL7M_01360 [Thermodesulfobacteriota bacterium]
MIELITEPCPCDMPGMRMKYKGRVDDLLFLLPGPKALLFRIIQNTYYSIIPAE